MLLQQFILENLHFAINIFTALVFFAVSWLYFDAWTQNKSRKELIKILGFAILSLSFLIHATFIEQTAITASTVFVGSYTEIIANSLKVIGYLLLVTGLLIEPLQKKPIYPSTAPSIGGQTGQVPAPTPKAVNASPQANPKQVSLVAGAFSIQNLPILAAVVGFPILSLVIFLLYFRKSVFGLENHLKPLTFGFFFIFLYDLFSISKLFENTNSISVYNIVKPFGPLWFIAHLLLFTGVVIIAHWVFGYLLRRIQTQFFMIFNISVLTIFLITTVCFTGLLLNNLRQDALSHLETDVNVVQYAISSKQNQTLSDAQLVSENSQIINAISAKDNKSLKELTTLMLLAKKQSYLIIVGSGGLVLMRGEDNEKIGDSLSNDPLFIKAIRGEKASSVVVKDGPIAPVVSIRSAVPVKQGQDIIGVVIVGTDIDNAFVDGLKSSTKLDVSVYGGNSLSATTFVAADGKSRFVGIKEENKQINKNVLNEGKNYSLEINILNTPYFASFAPLKDVDGNPVGMLFVGKEQISVIQAASRSVEYTFLLATLLILLSVAPSYFISKYIASQFK